jgi:succinate dehydrogenase / fumarate reductase flavoprotein subunit
MTEVQNFDHDVLVIRSRRRAASGRPTRPPPRSVGGTRVQSRCWARRTPSWPRVAVRRGRWANVDDRDNWQVHFADTLRGGSTSTTGGWRSCTPSEAPAQGQRARGVGALFDRTPDGRILQRNFGGHRYPRLAHVGDRTGLEYESAPSRINGVHQGMRLQFKDESIRSITLFVSSGPAVQARCVRPLSGAGSGCFRAKAIVDRTTWRYSDGREPHHQQQHGIHRNGHCRSPTTPAPRLMDMEFNPVPSHPVWSRTAERAGAIARNRGSPRRRRRAQERTAAGSCYDDIPENLSAQTRVILPGGWLVRTGEQERPAPPSC